MRHFITTENWSRQSLQDLLDVANRLKQHPWQQQRLDGRSIALLFLNPSMRTRTSFELGAQQLGAVAIVLQPGKDAWGVEFRSQVVMDGEAEEHIAEVAGVLSRYVDLIGLRAFPGFRDWQYDRRDPVITALARHASVPVINMETIVHPCQELALMIACKFGMDVTLLCPDADYLLDQRFMSAAQQFATESNGSLRVTHDIESAYSGAHVVYAKSWGALPHYGFPERERPIRERYRHFMVDGEKMAMTDNALFSHCLPLRRNVKATDEVMDADYCVALDEAENRLHVQKAIMLSLLDQEGV